MTNSNYPNRCLIQCLILSLALEHSKLRSAEALFSGSVLLTHSRNSRFHTFQVESHLKNFYDLLFLVNQYKSKSKDTPLLLFLLVFLPFLQFLSFFGTDLGADERHGVGNSKVSSQSSTEPTHPRTATSVRERCWLVRCSPMYCVEQFVDDPSSSPTPSCFVRHVMCCDYAA